MKGLEVMPIRFIASLAIIAMIVAVGFYELNVFLEFKTQKEFKEDMVDIYQAIKTQQSLGDKGSFTSLQLTVPSNYMLQIDNASNRLVGTLSSGEVYIVNLTADITKIYMPSGCMPAGCLLGAADYELRLVYGEPDSPRNYTIVFE
ncbi:MAG: hypothetical protein ACE5J7_03825 [Candidatus Aenigmatarchaeota archaeon]